MKYVVITRKIFINHYPFEERFVGVIGNVYEYPYSIGKGVCHVIFNIHNQHSFSFSFYIRKEKLNNPSLKRNFRAFKTLDEAEAFVKIFRILK